MRKQFQKQRLTLKAKNEEVAVVDPSNRIKMTELSYEFEELQKLHDDLLADWEKALIEKEKLEKN